MDYRFENHEFEARLELPVHIAIVVVLRLNEELANYASASFLRETGMCLLCKSIALSCLTRSMSRRSRRRGGTATVTTLCTLF